MFKKTKRISISFGKFVRSVNNGFSSLLFFFLNDSIALHNIFRLFSKISLVHENDALLYFLCKISKVLLSVRYIYITSLYWNSRIISKFSSVFENLIFLFPVISYTAYLLHNSPGSLFFRFPRACILLN